MNYYSEMIEAGKSQDFKTIQLLFQFRLPIMVVFYSVSLTINIKLITENFGRHSSSIFLIILGIVIMDIMTVPGGGMIHVPRNIRSNLDMVALSGLGLTLHYGPILVALGIYRFFRSVIEKKNDS